MPPTTRPVGPRCASRSTMPAARNVPAPKPRDCARGTGCCSSGGVSRCASFSCSSSCMGASSVQSGYLGMERADSASGCCTTLAEDDEEPRGLFVIRTIHPIRYLLIGELKAQEILIRLQLFAVFGFA